MDGSQQRVVDYAITDPKTLYEILKNLNINISFKDIKQPNIETLVTIYRGFLDMCLSIKAPLHDEIPIEAITNFSDDIVKSQSDTFRFLQLYSLINYFYTLMGSAYSMMEIFNPTKKMYFKQMSSVINFARFLLDELNEYGTIQDKNKAYCEKCNALLKECNDFDIKIDTLQIEAKQKKPLIDSAKKRIANLKEKQMKLREVRNKLTQKHDIAKKDEHTYTTEKDDLNEKINTLQKRMKLYETLLIKSPDRLRKDLEKTGIRIIDLQNLIKNKRLENDELKVNVDDRDRFIMIAIKTRDFLEDFFNIEIQRANVKYKEIKKMEQEIMTINYTVRELENLIDDKTKTKKAIELQVQTKTQEFEQQMAKLQREEQEISTKIQECLAQIQQRETENDQLNEEINKVVKRIQEFIALSFKQTEICQREERLISARFNAEEAYLLDFQKETLNKVEQVTKVQKSLDEFLDKAFEEFNKFKTINFNNF
ncbi:unnamed protein product [Brachionus calyciflorus]|uniref:Kinetochore protein Nuf2 N-terminal domain-containing protein n=1 Tax=Brachionus calyciflorus TaxID=104777 RepID=A0A813RZU3_9BILA|nr:unnamed protein product [Brachionus calyciflorus]